MKGTNPSLREGYHGNILERAVDELGDSVRLEGPRRNEPFPLFLRGEEGELLYKEPGKRVGLA